MQTNNNKWFSHLIILILIISGGIYTGCENEEEIDSSIILKAFGPSPALRGGELRFIGSNLDKVTAVVFQGLTHGETVEVSEIEVVNEKEIRVTIPQNAGTGKVTLKTPQGDIQTLTPLTFSEPISISSVTPTTLRAGQILTVKGDYLNLIKKVIFVDNVEVEAEDFVSQSREQLQVKVPAEAQTGKIILSNGEEIPIEIYSNEIINIILPTFTNFTPVTVKPGKNIDITGTNLDLVAGVKFGGNKIVNELILNADSTQITVTVPLEAQDDTIKLITKSGLEVKGNKKLITVMPSNLTVSPTTVKNGNTLTIKGKDLDLVESIKFGDIVGQINSKSETEISVTVPETAISTVATLVTFSTKTIDTPEFSYVKPKITALSPSTLMAGSELTVTGTDLDLIRKVIFPSATKVVSVEPSSSTSFVVNVPTDATSGIVKFVTVNGTEISSPSELTVTEADIPVITSIPASVKPGQLLIIQGTKLNLVESVIFQDNVKATLFGLRSATLLEVFVPENAAKGAVTLKLITFAGKEVSVQITISGTDPITDPSYVFFDFDGKNSWWGSYGKVENDPSLSLSGNYFRINQDLPSGWVDFFWRNSQNDMKVSGVTVNEWAVKMDVNVLGGTTMAFKFRLKGTDGDFWAIIPGMENRGGWYTVTIPLTDFKDDNGYGTNTLPNVQNITQDFGLATAGDAGFVNMCIDNVRFEKIK
ncbi:MAG: IPT/TIG domain-containing protein [Paludibacteraceae bacterium]|nr:IPT/TIG domain-containing protein [Paludibacteraceae bacterium]